MQRCFVVYIDLPQYVIKKLITINLRLIRLLV